MATIPEALAAAIEHHRGGRLSAAELVYRRILQADPNHADALHLLGVIAHQVGKHELAVKSIERAIGLDGTTAVFHNNLGEAKRALGKIPEAATCYRRALELKPDCAEAHYNLGSVLTDQGELDQAVACFQRALDLKPDYAKAHNNLGIALVHKGKLDQAVASYRRALELNADFPTVYNNLGGALKELGKLNESVVCFRRALTLKPDFAEAHNNLGSTLKNQGQTVEAVACYNRALELKSDDAETHSNLLLTLHYCADVTLAALATVHAEYDRRLAAPQRGAIVPHTNSHGRQGRLRLGFVSPDLCRHPIGFFLVSVLENLNKKTHDIVCYSDRVNKDDLTKRLQSAATEWSDVKSLSDERLAEQIRADRIDILFDLAGHTAHNRLLVFARKPAPVQVTWAGYVGTTGLTAMDYLLADRYHVPPDAEEYYQEQVLRMPHGYVCYEPPAYAPPVAPLPAQGRGRVTFGCFNNPAKVTPNVIEVWSRILQRLSDARLVLKYRGWNDPGVVHRFGELFVAKGIDPARVEFLGHSPHARLLAEYNRIDLALDPFPYSGGLTTCEALWMGVPVITCPLETFASRHSLSHLSNVGLTETIARDLDDYVGRAVSWAEDLPRLARTRARLRKRLASSPLCDAKRFVDDLMRVLHDADAY